MTEYILVERISKGCWMNMGPSIGDEYMTFVGGDFGRCIACGKGLR
jgi:hypothetical protein